MAVITAAASVARAVTTCITSSKRQQLDLEALRSILEGAPPGGSCEYERPDGLRFSSYANPHDPRAEVTPAPELLTPQSIPEEREP